MIRLTSEIDTFTIPDVMDWYPIKEFWRDSKKYCNDTNLVMCVGLSIVDSLFVLYD